MHRYVALICLMIVMSLGGCSTLGKLVADSALGGGGPSLDANVGQAKTEGDDSLAQNAVTAVALQAGSEQSIEGGVESVANNYGLKWWELGVVVLLAGWAIPSPSEMGRGVVSFIRALWGKD